ncbi:natural killer cells antigen CD94-like [Tachyglossus aculeatus]|uniref:natural killer cells antigen CD94-like n=1 Tax=Tachyglossus aculeatus TaxID=9261 RepID=UPI0018F797E6|nr:natural killer cells antigen CD94-like [Tachyglossus aculeatus]
MKIATQHSLIRKKRPATHLLRTEMERHQVTYSELNVHNPSQQPDGRTPKHKGKFASSKQHVIYTELKNSKPSQQQQHRKSKNNPNRDPEQQVTYAEVKKVKSSQNRGYTDVENTGLEREQQATYTDLKLPGHPQLQDRCEVGWSKDSLSPAWRLIVGTLGILCLGLVATVVTMTLQVFQMHYFQGDNSMSASNYSVTSLKECHNGPCLENWIAYRNRCYLFSKESASWEGSRIACAAKNSSLLQIDSREELDFLKLLSLYHWMGLSLPENAKSWQWTDGSPLSSDLFKVTQSNTRWTCVLYGSHSGNSEFAKNCSVDERYICESSSR